MQIQGIDVSYSQDGINWGRVKASGINFAVIRAGFCYNNGALKQDRRFKSHIEGAIAAGLQVGIYVYSYATDATAARRAARETLELIKPYKLTYPIAFDMEYEDIYTNSNPAKNSMIMDAFCDEIEKHGYYAMMYASKDFFMRLLDMDKLKRYDIWCAQYASKCTYPGNYGIWQYIGDAGRVDGVPGACDRNISYKDYPGIIRRAGLNGL